MMFKKNNNELVFWIKNNTSPKVKMKDPKKPSIVYYKDFAYNVSGKGLLKTVNLKSLYPVTALMIA